MRDALTTKDTEIDLLQRENEILQHYLDHAFHQYFENLKKKMDEMEQKLKNSTEDLVRELDKTLLVRC